jgi:hypothetical protein
VGGGDSEACICEWEAFVFLYIPMSILFGVFRFWFIFGLYRR